MKTKKKLNISISILAFTTNAVNTDNTIEIMIIVDATVFRQLQNDFLLKTFFLAEYFYTNLLSKLLLHFLYNLYKRFIYLLHKY